MAISVGTSEPTEFTAGDTVSWQRTEAEYTPPTWNLVYYFAGPTRFSIATTDVGTTAHLATMPTAAATVAPGDYVWTVKATDGTQNITLASGTMRVLPGDLSTNAELTTLEAQLASAKTAYYALAQRKNSSVSVDGINYTAQNAEVLWRFILLLERRIQTEKDRLAGLLGQGRSGLFVTRFRN